MPEWEYRKIDLNERPRMTDEIDLIGDAGMEGWDLLQITANNIAYLKRVIEDPAPAQHSSVNGHDTSAHAVKARYRDPATGETWSGRGRMANWLKAKQDAGQDIEMYRV